MNAETSKCPVYRVSLKDTEGFPTFVVAGPDRHRVWLYVHDPTPTVLRLHPPVVRFLGAALTELADWVQATRTAAGAAGLDPATGERLPGMRAGRFRSAGLDARVRRPAVGGAVQPGDRDVPTGRRAGRPADLAARPSTPLARPFDHRWCDFSTDRRGGAGRGGEMSEHQPDPAICQQHDEDEPSGMRLVLHAAALMLIGAIYQGIGNLIWRIMSWVNGHMDDGSPWAQRGYEYNRRAFRVIRPWWESEERRARWCAEGAARWRAQQEARQRAEQGERHE